MGAYSKKNTFAENIFVASWLPSAFNMKLIVTLQNSNAYGALKKYAQLV